MKHCCCCNSQLKDTFWDVNELLEWYSLLGNNALVKECSDLLYKCKFKVCDNCGYATFVMVNDVTNEYYNSLIKSFDKYFPKDRVEWHIAKEYILENSNFNRTVMDIGCGSGYFLNSLDKKLQTIGIDFDESSSMHSEFQFLKIDLNGSFYLQTAEYYTCFHVLEHVVSPERFLKSIYNSMNDESILMLSVPNSKNYRNIAIKDPLNCAPHHLHNFNSTSLSMLFEKLKFKFDITFVESISLPRILARIYSQNCRKVSLKAWSKVIYSYFFKKNTSYESCFIRAHK